MLRNPHRSLRNKCDAHTRDAAPTRAASAAPTHPCAFLPMPSNPRKHRNRAIYDSLTRRCAEQVSDHVLETAEQPQKLLPDAELAPHLVRHNWCVTTTANDTATRNTRGTRHAAVPVVATRSTRSILHVVLHCHRGCARRSRVRTVAQCLRTRRIQRAHPHFTAPLVTGALPLVACVAKRCMPTQRISAQLRRLGHFPEAVTRAHLQWILRPSCN